MPRREVQIAKPRLRAALAALPLWGTSCLAPAFTERCAGSPLCIGRLLLPKVAKTCQRQARFPGLGCGIDSRNCMRTIKRMSSLLPHLSLLTLLVALPLAAQPAPASVPKALSQAEGWRVANQIRTVAAWELIDAVHEKAGTISGAQEIEQSYKALDQMTVFAGSEHGVDGARLESCLLKQDAELVEHSLAVGQRVGVNQTPTFFVNGARVLGVASEEFVFSLVDKALQAK